jgi:hypothetical protein
VTDLTGGDLCEDEEKKATRLSGGSTSRRTRGPLFCEEMMMMSLVNDEERKALCSPRK